jgi:hypothetical protein
MIEATPIGNLEELGNKINALYNKRKYAYEMGIEISGKKGLITRFVPNQF